MARYHKQRISYPMGSVSCGTMRNEDLIPTFAYELQTRRRHHTLKRHHASDLREIERRMSQDGYYESEDADFDLEWLFDALDEYAGPYFYFGSHPGDGCDYGYWLSEGFDEDFLPVTRDGQVIRFGTPTPYRTLTRDDMPCSIKVADLAYVPKWFRGEVLHVSDHGNMTLYVKTCRTLREVWGIV